MFTGIVEEIGFVKKIEGGSRSIKLTIQCNTVLSDVKVGDSIAVNGVCLTVTRYGEGWFQSDVMPETMNKTSLLGLKANSKVNLERALRLCDRVGGHIVSGHIDNVGTIIKKRNDDNAIWLTVKAEDSVLKYIILKGSVALDGTSLTVANVEEGLFEVSLIPHTLGVTILGDKKVGDIINIECDIIGKYVEKQLAFINNNNSDNKITVDFLKQNGFV